LKVKPKPSDAINKRVQSGDQKLKGQISEQVGRP
jgi:hypothetical protein